MKLKQTIKKFAGILGVLTMIGAPVAMTVTAYAGTCGGVTTVVISCDQQGACPSSGIVNPNEGANPNPSNLQTSSKDYPQAAVDAYIKQYSHAYGYCDKDGKVKPSNDTTQGGIWGLLLFVLNIMTAGVGIAAVGGVVYGSILYTSAGGNADQTKKAIEFIRNVIIGVIAYGLMFSLLNFIIPGGLFG